MGLVSPGAAGLYSWRHPNIAPPAIPDHTEFFFINHPTPLHVCFFDTHFKCTLFHCTFIHFISFIHATNLPDSRERFIRGLILDWTRRIHSSHFVHPSAKFYSWPKSAKFWPRFSTPVAFVALWFQNGATRWKVGTSTWSVLRSSQTFDPLRP